jgi:hypothetical protein
LAENLCCPERSLINDQTANMLSRSAFMRSQRQLRLALWFLPREMREEQGEEAEDDVLEGELKRGRQRVDDADGGDPDAEVGDEEGQDAAGVPARGAEVGEDGAGVEVGFCVRVGEGGQRDRDERAVEELVEQHLGRDGGGGVAFADEVGEDAVPEIDFDTFVGPEGGEERALGPGVAGGGEAEIEEGKEAAEEAGRDDGEGEAEFAAPGAEAVEGVVGRGVPEVGEDEGEGEGLEDEAGDKIGAGAAETGGPGGFAGGGVGGNGNGRRCGHGGRNDQRPLTACEQIPPAARCGRCLFLTQTSASHF